MACHSNHAWNPNPVFSFPSFMALNERICCSYIVCEGEYPGFPRIGRARFVLLVIAIFHSDHFLALNVLIEIWYVVVQVASHSKNPRAHHGSQRKLSTALSSDLTFFIATNFSNDDVVHEEERKDPPAAVSPIRAIYPFQSCNIFRCWLNTKLRCPLHVGQR
jgi:hypothetical protein